MKNLEILNQLKLNNYKSLLIGQLIILVLNLIVFEFFRKYPFPGHKLIYLALLVIVLSVINYIAYLMLQNFTENKKLRFFILLFLIVATALGAIGSFPKLGGDNLVRNTIVSVSIFLSLLSFIALLVLMMQDIFKENHDILYRLWGAASIYILIGVIFAMTYTLLDITFPNEFGLAHTTELEQFISCYNYSFYILSGIDLPENNFSDIVKNIGVVESIFSNLYIVLLVGRLLAK